MNEDITAECLNREIFIIFKKRWKSSEKNMNFNYMTLTRKENKSKENLEE